MNQTVLTQLCRAVGGVCTVLGLLLGLVVGMVTWAGATEKAAEANDAFALQPFRSDGCSLFPDGNLEFNDNLELNELWLECCLAHDVAYWVGGTYEEREAADEALRECVAGVGEPEIAVMMLMGVRVGGSPYFDTPFRWGYGWPYLQDGELRGYKPLSEAEWLQVRKLRPSIVKKD